MNRNSLFGLLGITLLTFLGAFILGRWTRPTPLYSASQSAGEFGSAFTTEQSNAIKADAESDRLLAAMRTAAYQEEAIEEYQALNAPTTSDKLRADTKSRSKEITKKSGLASAASANSPDTAQLASTASAGVADMVRDSALANESITPKTVIAKDVVAIEERQHYAAQLPKELLKKGMKATINVVGEQADVIIMSSPSFDAQSRDTVIKQVCIELKALGFKRVHITDGGSYTMNFGL
ncbi:hypothetical protein H8B13_19535 [Hymenobacter sp. BT188]|uniref:hypothetical protein n=1 Tax=Hymenobacter sp. BT188 TaxID=2763504 RepID=UPI001650DD50|nr:hypothetical protein [Hymenobacter sp. BT188]MBC6609021.1 hypothetical protein [Hymenobacter sp. BT188]